MNSLANTTLEVLASNPALRNAMIQLQEDNARLRAERDAARDAAARWRNRARFWRAEAWAWCEELHAESKDSQWTCAKDFRAATRVAWRDWRLNR